MMQLNTLQNYFLADLIPSYYRHGTGSEDNSKIESKTEHSAKRMAIYQNNYYGTHIKTLANRYPVTERLLGTAYFKQLARFYIEAHPSITCNLNEYGLAFSQFILSLQLDAKHELASIPYLVDIVNFELAIERVLFGHSNCIFDFEAFAKIPSEEHENIVLTLAENSQMITSNFPLAKIWEVNQSAEVEETIDINQESSVPYTFILWRPDLELRMMRLNASQTFLIHCLKQGLTLKQLYTDNSYNSSFEEAEKMNISLALPELISLGCITNFVMMPAAAKLDL